MNRPWLIILNGPGSVGKSTIAQALQAMASEPFLHVGGDAFLTMLPKHIWQHPEGVSVTRTVDAQGAPILDIQIGSIVDRALCGMRAAVAALAGEGNNLIVDVIMTNVAEQDDFRRRLGRFNPFFVGVHAPLDIIEARERARGDRMPGVARWQYRRVHAGMRYDLEIDTSINSPAACAGQIATAAGLGRR